MTLHPEPHLPHRVRQKIATTNAVLDAAERVIAARGVAGTAMQDVAETAGVAVGTLYNYFGDRVGLLRALVTRHREALAVAVASAMSPEAGFEASAVDFAAAVFELFDTRRDFVKAALDSELWRALLSEPYLPAPNGARVRHQLEARCAELVAQGISEGLLSSEENAELLGVFLSGGVRGVLLQRAVREQNPPPRRDAERVVNLFLRGAMPRDSAARQRKK